MSHRRSWRRFGLFCALLGALTLSTGQDCVPPGPGDGDLPPPPPPADQRPNIAFTQPTAGTLVVIGEPVTIAMNAQDPENDFTYTLVYDRDGVFNGNEVEIETGSRKGTSLVQTSWSTQGLPAGTYYIGAIVTDSAGNTDRKFTQPITLVAAPSVTVLSPSGSFTREAGQKVNIVFSATDPVGGATVDVFYDTDDNFANGVAGMIRQGMLATATGAEWDTLGVPPGTYFIGVSIGTDATGRVASYASGQVTILGAGDPGNGDAPPAEDVVGLQLSVTAPATPTTISKGASLKIDFEGRDPTGQAWIDLYYVPVSSGQGTPPYTGDEPKIATNLPLTARSYTWKTDVDPGLYAIGATLGRSETARIRAMAPGRVLVTPPPDWDDDDDDPTTPVTITLMSPADVYRIRPQDFFPIIFEVNPAHASGTVRVYYARDEDQDHEPDPGSDWTQFAVRTVPPSTSTTIFSPAALGLGEGIYAFKAVYEPEEGSNFYADNPDGDVAAGWVSIRSIAWMGDVATPLLRGAIFEGVNFYDLAGTSMTPVADIDGDGIDDFVIVSQFGKPGWDGFGVEGAGVGEAYVIYGGPHLEGRRWKLNATGVQDPIHGLPGLVLAGLETRPPAPFLPPPPPPPEAATPGDRGGISGVMAIPDQDGDGRPELVFSFPSVWSAPDNDGPFDGKKWLTHLAREGQFSNGGYVTISSRNSLFGNPNLMPSGGRTYVLSDVGQRFTGNARTPFTYQENWGCKPAIDPAGDPIPDDCSICCQFNDPECQPMGCTETVRDHGIGFSRRLAADAAFPDWDNDPEVYAPVRGRCDCPGTGVLIGGGACYANHSLRELSTGFLTGISREPYGLRMIAQADDDFLASSMSFVDDMLLVSAPGRNLDRGIAYRLQLRNRSGLAYQYYHGQDLNPGPRPYQYVVLDHDNCRPGGYGSPTYTFYYSGATGGEQLGYAISGVADMNADGLGDVVIGVPGAFNGDGALYLVYRRVPSLDSDRDLRRIELGEDDQGRRFGVLIRGRTGERLGKVVGTGADLNGSNSAEYLDLNQDGRPDLVFGNYHHDGDRGEVVVLFGNPNLESPAGGFRIDDLVDLGLGALIKGENVGDKAGFNVAYAGDFNGDGWYDLLVAAPGADVEVDRNGDGQLELLAGAGKVYLILGANRFEPGRVYCLSMVGRPDDPDFDPDDPSPEAYMKKGLRGLVFAGHRAGDALGGGQEPSFDQGGIGATGWRGRSISWAGDVNDDGYDDILIGAPQADAGEFGDPGGVVKQAGEVYLIFGHSF